MFSICLQEQQHSEHCPHLVREKRWVKGFHFLCSARVAIKFWCKRLFQLPSAALITLLLGRSQSIKNISMVIWDMSLCINCRAWEWQTDHLKSTCIKPAHETNTEFLKKHTTIFTSDKWSHSTIFTSDKWIYSTIQGSPEAHQTTWRVYTMIPLFKGFSNQWGTQ